MADTSSVGGSLTLNVRIFGRAAPPLPPKSSAQACPLPHDEGSRGGCLRAQGPLGTCRNTAPGSCLLTVHSGWKLVSVHEGGSLLVSPRGSCRTARTVLTPGPAARTPRRAVCSPGVRHSSRGAASTLEPTDRGQRAPLAGVRSPCHCLHAHCSL